jgi:nitrogen fixation protein FixH
MTTVSTSAFRVRGWHVAAGVTAFFTLVIGVDTAFMVLAYRTFPGQVSVTPYEDGLLYNRHIAQQEAQEKLGWRAAAAATPGVVTLQFRDAEGAPVRGLAVNGKLERPATETGRAPATFRETAPGQYVARVGGLSGAWDLTAEARAPDSATFTVERRLTWP